MANVEQSVAPQDTQRMELRSLVKLASETISHYWPMQTFIHHNPLHGLEHLPFEEAIDEAKKYIGGNGYLPNSQYRNYFQQGRISPEAIREVLKPRAQEESVVIGDRTITHLDVLETIFVHGTGTVEPDVASAVLDRSLSETDVTGLREKLQDLSRSQEQQFSLNFHADREQNELGSEYTLAHWCDATLGTGIQDQINQELIKWCGGFLDEGHAPWPMPRSNKTFYDGWKMLAQEDWTGPLSGIQGWKSKIRNLPDLPSDAIGESLETLAIPQELWIGYFTLHLAQLPGWTGFIKWRSEQSNHQWQQAFPIDLVRYIAIRLFYERELVARTCEAKLGIPGTFTSIQSFLRDHPNGYGLYKEWRTRGLAEQVVANLDLSLFIREPLPIDELDRQGVATSHTWQTVRQRQAKEREVCILVHLARCLDCSARDLIESPSETLEILLDWVDRFPESHHGPLWLHALERSFVTDFVQDFSPNIRRLRQSDESGEHPSESRPSTQAIFCIDVRSEGFRRHLEEVGGNETFGFAGFFGVPLCFSEFGSEHETDQCPVLLKPKHIIKEVPRAYQANAADKFLERQQLAKTGHTLLHDLKENVITPYVMVEAIGWFFGFRLFGQTLAPLWYERLTSWVKDHFDISLGTTLTVEKLPKDEAEEMVASEHRAIIYRMLIERFGRLGNAVSHDQVERLRKQALNEVSIDNTEDQELHRLLHWTEADHEKFLQQLMGEYGVHKRAVTNRMHRITQRGFTTTEQAHYVETALRILGYTKTFSRLVLACGHASTSDNNPYESALDCGACGGNHGVSNARAFAAMANKGQVRQLLAKKGITIPADTHFLPGQHDTTTDEVQLFDLEDVPATHRKDLNRLIHDLEEAGRRNSLERLSRFPEGNNGESLNHATARTKLRSVDWSQVRPEWGLSRHTAFIVGRRGLTHGLNLEGRTFLHSYDHRQDPTGKYLEIIMTAPMIVANWINMEHYFSTVDPVVYGSGSKVYHNVVGRVGVMYGSQSDLCIGLPLQTVLDVETPYHEPMRLYVIIEAPMERISMVIARHEVLKRLVGNQWINLVALDPVTMEFFHQHSLEQWQRIQ